MLDRPPCHNNAVVDYGRDPRLSYLVELRQLLTVLTLLIIVIGS